MADNKARIARFVEETLNKGNLNATAEFVWKDAVEWVPFPGQGPGAEGIKQVIGQFRAAFPDLHFAIEEQIAEGDKVVTRFEWTGTHRGDFLGIPPTGKNVRVWGIVIDRLVDGRIKETRMIMDTLGMMVQMDVVAGPE